MSKIARLFFISFFLSAVYSSAFGVSSLGCFGAAFLELPVPGLGYGLTKQWDKMISFGLVRHGAIIKASEGFNSEYYQKPDQIYVQRDAEESNSGKYETDVYLNRETWEARFYSSINFDLLLTTWGDMYLNDCENNVATYHSLAAPVDFPHFYKKWMFWAPISLLVYNHMTFDQYSEVNYFLGRGLTRNQLERESYAQYYLVGVGEEMFFRGTIQTAIFRLMRDDWDIHPRWSRHLSILSAASIFGAAHSGTGFSADSIQAFLYGVYQGYVFHPSLDEFDLTTAIAIHSWWDIIIAYTILSHAEFHETDSRVEVPLLQIGFMF